MKNENDKWIMDGIDWNNPECIHLSFSFFIANLQTNILLQLYPMQ